MAKAKKLKSGNWRCQVYSYTDAAGKRHYESFTASTRKEAEYLAAEFARDKDSRVKNNMTVAEVVENYITIKESVLSPSTIRGYRGIARNYIHDNFIGAIPSQKLSSVDVQRWVGEITARVSPKTVRNAYGLLTAALELFCPDLRVRATLPQPKDAGLYVPSDEDIKRLLEHIRGKELEIAVLLAAFGPMRRGEICALESSDIHGNLITVNKAMVLTSSGEWVVKQPKTMSSYRTIEFPQFVIDRLSGIDGRIIKATPDQISNRFARAIHFSGLPKFRFHDLRHYAASIMHAIGIADQYIMERGGWSSDWTMKHIYIGTISDEKKRVTGNINRHFEDMQHEMQHKKEKTL